MIEPGITVRVDSSRHEVIITSGPNHLTNMPPMSGHAMMDMMSGEGTSPVQRFVWPVDGWFRGFRIEVTDARGQPLPKRLMHHMIMVNFDRRQLLYPAAERLMGAGSETGDATVPATIGVPMKSGMRLGMYTMWHNESGADIDGVYLKIHLLYSPRNQNPRPLDALPIYMDVNLTVGGSNVFDVPPGHSEKSYEFTLPVGGKLLGVGGHLHDYGSQVRLEDVATGKVLTSLNAVRDSAGFVTKMPQRLFGVSGEGLSLQANHRYRVVGVYNNPTGKMIEAGAMAHMVGLFVPSDTRKWPQIDPNDPEFRKDLASLDGMGKGGMEGMEGMDHSKMSHDHMQHE